MTAPTLTELRKNLFQVVDQMLTSEKPYRVRRGGRVIELSARVVALDARDLSPEERWARFMERPERKTDKPSDFDSLENADHWEWQGEVDPR